MKKQTTIAVIFAALGNIIWGFSFLFTRVALSITSPDLLLAHRFIFATTIMLVPVLLGKIKISFKGKRLGPVCLLLFFQLAYYWMESYSVLHTNSTISGLVLAVVPMVTIGTGALFLKEYPTKRQAFFCLMPVAGIILMTVSGKELGVIKPLGILFLLLTLLSSALYKTVNRKVAEEFTPYERTFMVLAISAISFTVTGLNSTGWNIGEFMVPLANPTYLGSVLSLSVLCSIVANLLVNYAVGRMSVFKVSSFGALSTLCTMVAGILFLKEPVNWQLLLGAALILVGIRQITRPVPQKEENISK